MIIRYTDGSTYEGPYVDDTCLDMLGQVSGSDSISGGDSGSVNVSRGKAFSRSLKIVIATVLVIVFTVFHLMNQSIYLILFCSILFYFIL